MPEGTQGPAHPCGRAGGQGPSSQSSVPPADSRSLGGLCLQLPALDARPGGASPCLGSTNGCVFKRGEPYSLEQMGCSNFLNSWFLLIFKK